MPWHRAAPQHGTEVRLGPTEGGQATGTFEADERLESGPHEGCLLVDLGQSAGLFEEVIVDIERRFHTYKYGLFIHIIQVGPELG